MRGRVLAGALLVVGLARVTAVSGQEAKLFGYELGATSDAVSILYDQPSFGVPAKPTFEVRNFHGATALNSGPSAHALASVLWPGDVIGNAPPSLALEVLIFDPTASGSLKPVIDAIKMGAGEASQDFPAYPVRAEAFFPRGPAQNESQVAAGTTMRARAARDDTEAVSTSGGVGFPGAVSVGSIRSSSASRIDADTAISEARSVISDLDLFGGIVHIDQVFSSASSTSDGSQGKLAGTVAISGMSIGGQPVVVDDKGIHLADQNLDPTGELAAQLMKQVLEPNGITLEFAKPIDEVKGASASRGVSALKVSLDSRGMQAFFKTLPPDVQELIRNPAGGPLSSVFDLFSPSVAGFVGTPFQFDQTLSFVFGSVAVQSSASVPFETSLPPPASTPTPPSTGGPPLGGGEVAPPGPSVQPPGPPTFTGTPQALTLASVSGVPAGLIALMFLLMLAGAYLLRRWADRVTVAAVVETCPLENR